MHVLIPENRTSPNILFPNRPSPTRKSHLVDFEEANLVLPSKQSDERARIDGFRERLAHREVQDTA